LESAKGGEIFLDLGCNWGRWVFSAATSGYVAIGLDPWGEAVLAAKRVSQQLGLPTAFIIGDAGSLPIDTESVDVVFAYSVLQHFDKAVVRACVRECHRVLRPNGICLLEFANAHGVTNVVKRTLLAFSRQPKDGPMAMRYWSLAELRAMFDQIFGSCSIEADGYFSINPQRADMDLLPKSWKLVVLASDWLKRKTLICPPLLSLADSVYVRAIKR